VKEKKQMSFSIVCLIHDKVLLTSIVMSKTCFCKFWLEGFFKKSKGFKKKPPVRPKTILVPWWLEKGNLNSKENVSSVVKMGTWKPTARRRRIKVKTKDSKENISNVEREVIWLTIVKEWRMERSTKTLINLNQTNPNKKDQKALKVLPY
jgi:hypothetical protein